MEQIKQAPLNIGLERPVLNGRVNFPLCLAPMVGLSHMAFRLLVRQYLPEGAFTIWPTEMLNSRRLPTERVGETPETLRASFETGLVPQILANEEDAIARSLPRLAEWGAEGIDINMGCPVKKALRHNYGVSLMGDPEYAAEVVRMVTRHTHLPVSVKIRAGYQRDQMALQKFVEGLVDAGASWICLHPRLAHEKRRGFADWGQIRDLRSQVAIPVIGNGDIQTHDDVFQMLEETGCDMVMAGRAVTARPWIFWQVGERLGFPPPVGRQGSAPQTPEEEAKEMGRALKYLLIIMQESFSEELALRKFKFHLRHASVWLNFGHALEAKVSGLNKIEDCLSAVTDFFEQPLALSAYTDLRY